MSHFVRPPRARNGSALRALPLLLLLLACSPSDPMEQVKALHREGHFDASLEPLRALLAKGADDPELHYRYGLALRRAGEPGLAIWSLRRASQAADWQVVAGLELAAAALQNNSFPAAIDAATRVLEVEPDNFQALHLRGMARLYEKTDPTAALADFDHMLEIDPEDFPAQAQRVAALLLLQRVDEAARALEALDEEAAAPLLDPRTRAHLCVAAATFARERGDVSEAEATYSGCLEEFPAHYLVVAEAVQFFDERRKPRRASEVLRNALAAQPEAAAFRSALAERLRERGRAADAEALLREGTQLENRSAASQTWVALANHHHAQDDYAAAADAYERALAGHPEPDQRSLLNLADLHALAGDRERALEIADRFEAPLFRDLIHARVHLEAQRPREALDRLDAALRLWPDNPSARYFAARASEQIGDFDRAIEEYRQSVRAGAGQTDAGFRLARLHAAEEAWHAAVIAAGHHLREHADDAEALLFALRAADRLQDRRHLEGLLTLARKPTLWAQAQAVRAEAIAAREGPEAAEAALRDDPHLDLAHPRDAAALRALVIQLDAAGRGAEAEPLVATALAAHPDAAEFLAVRGLLLERRDAPAAQVRASYEEAVAAQPEHPAALLGMAGVEERAGALEAAVAYCDRAAAANPSDPTPTRRAASLLAAAGRAGPAEERFEAHLREHPYDAKAALALARLRIARGADRAQTLRLARQAERFGGAEEAQALLTQLAQLDASSAPSDGRTQGSTLRP